MLFKLGDYLKFLTFQKKPNHYCNYELIGIYFETAINKGKYITKYIKNPSALELFIGRNQPIETKQLDSIDDIHIRIVYVSSDFSIRK